MVVEGMLIATGATPRSLPGTAGIRGVHTLRTLATLVHCAARSTITPAGRGHRCRVHRCRGRGDPRGRDLPVTLIEALPVPLGRVLGHDIGMLMADIHREHGVDLRLGVGVDGIDGAGRVERVRLSDGTHVDADLVVVGVGVVPNTGWLEGSGLTIDNGVVCDATALAAPGITAAGDVARWYNPRFDETARVEHWDHAIEMAAHTARRLLGAMPSARSSSRCRSSGPINTTERSNSRAGRAPTTPSRSSPARSTSVGSRRSTDEADASWRCSA